MSENLTKIREWIDSDEPEPEDGWEWPHPPICVESRVGGNLRADILRRLGRPLDDEAEIRLVETEVEDGWSEFTPEVDHGIEVWVHEGRRAQRVWDTDLHSDGDYAMTRFLAWTQEAAR